jgi:two-component system OmpR family response regulator
MSGETRSNIRALVVGDNENVVVFMRKVLADAGCDVRSAGNGEAALREASVFRPNVVFLDVLIPEQDGWLVCSKLKFPAHAPRIVLMTGMPEAHVDDFARFVHADDVLRKPFTEVDVLAIVNRLSGD